MEEAIFEPLLALQPEHYPYLMRVTLQVYHAVEVNANRIQVDFWFGKPGASAWAFDAHQLHVTCYEADFGPWFGSSWFLPNREWSLTIESLRDRHLERKWYAVREEEMETLFYCHSVEARLEEVEFVYKW